MLALGAEEEEKKKEIQKVQIIQEKSMIKKSIKRSEFFRLLLNESGEMQFLMS